MDIRRGCDGRMGVVGTPAGARDGARPDRAVVRVTGVDPGLPVSP